MVDLITVLMGGSIRPELLWVVELMSIVFIFMIVVLIFRLVTPWKR